MTYGPIQKISTTFEQYSKYWLKGYEQGTSTPLQMATDAAAGTLLAKAEISDGTVIPIGFIKTAGDVIFIPYFNAAYDLFLFPTAAEADANDTTNAIQVADNITPEILYSYATQLEAQTGTENTHLMTPLRVAEAIAALETIKQIASQAEAEAGTDNTKGMTPLRVSQAIGALGTTGIGEMYFGNTAPSGYLARPCSAL